MSRSIKQRRPAIYLVGAILGAAALAGLASPGAERFHAAGPSNPGHALLDCSECHRPAVGTPRQQLQAKASALLGLREYDADFVHREVRTRDCQACHLREDDRHPVYRFDEPRFVDARAALGANRCTGCHVEHSGRRASVTSGFCETCHSEIKIKEEPLRGSPAISHAELAETGRWATCMTCHDFHGNHKYAPPSRMEEALSEAAVFEYLSDGVSPYGPATQRALRTRAEMPAETQEDAL